MSPMSEKTVLVTGATAGIGKIAAREIAKQGARVVIVGRNKDKTEGVVAQLKAAAGHDRIDFLLADLSSIGAVKRLGQQVVERYPKLDVLLNNAGAINMTRETTVDGFERTFATNHLAYFVLANAVLPSLRRAAPGARIVNVSSDAHRVGALNFDDLQATAYNSWMQYGRSKLCNLLFTLELAERVKADGITVNALHPGFVASDFLSKGGLWKLVQPVANLFAINEDAGAKTSIYLATSPDVAQVTGKYFYKCKQRRPRSFALDAATAKRLWQVSEALTANIEAAA